MENNERTNERRKLLVSLILPMLLGSVFANFFLIKDRHNLVSQKEKALLQADSSLSVKLQVEKHMNEVQENLSASQIKNDDLYTVVSKLNTELTERKKTIEKITKENHKVASLKKQLKDSKYRLDDYQKQINGILKENGDFQHQVAELNKIITDIKRDNDELKKKLEWAKDLKGYELNVLNFKVHNEKKKLTIRAKKVNRITVSFTLAENLAAESGSKNVYLVLYDPNKNVLTTKQEKFFNKKTNSEQVYSTLKTIDFKNEEQKIFIDFDAESKLIKGKYKAEIYTDGNLSGTKEFELR